jgi:tetraacyldisaccharide 4'-kinase
VAERRALERLWWGTDLPSRLARAALRPAEAVYASVVATRGILYDAGVLRAHPTALPAISVGNLSVGGTGKTPLASWIAARLLERGARPAIVLRGYGSDEPLVHATLTPDVPVVVAPDRVRGVAEARVMGADVAVLDDAFQHRRARRHTDLVLVSADRWHGPHRLLPAGPWREPLRALRRASVIVVTRKAASAGEADGVAHTLQRAAPDVPIAVAHLAPGELRAATGPDRRPLRAIARTSVFAIAAIADPHAFVRQLIGVGAHVEAALFADHHAFTPAEVLRLAVAATGRDAVVCTLKDAVKLAPHWPRQAPPLWYVSQHVVIERGADALDARLEALLAARPSHFQHAGKRRP